METKHFKIRGYVFRPMVANRLTKSLKFEVLVEGADKDQARANFRQIQPSTRYVIKSIVGCRNISDK
jgi:hypothetical protein